MNDHPKIDGLDLRKTEAPERGLSVEEYMEILKRDRVVHVPCPHGEGWYRVELKAGAVYFSSRLTWIAREQNGPWGRKAAPAYLRSRYGREILWYPRGLGVMRSHDTRNKFTNPDDFYLYTAKMVIGFIVSGRRLYRMTCGQNINSLNTDENPYAHRQ